MTGTIIFRVPGIATGPDVDLMPVLFVNPPLHSAGVGGYSYRFVGGTGGDLPTGEGDPVTTWPARFGTPLELVKVAGTTTASSATIASTAHGFTTNQPVIFAVAQAPLVAGTVYYARDVTTNNYAVAATSGGTAITITAAGSVSASAAGKRPTVHLDSTTGEAMARTDGTDDELVVSGFANLTDLLTVTAVLRVTTATGTNRSPVSFNSVALTRTNTNTASLGSIGTVAEAMTNRFVVATSVLEAGKQAIQVNSTRATPGSTVSLANYRLRLGQNGGTFTAADFLEVIAWPYGLSAAECNAVYAAMQARWGALLT